jgi:hypothetical protein
VEITSGTVGGGSLVALLATVCLFLLFHRKHNRSQTEKQIIDEFDLSTEHRNEEPDVDEHFFDLHNDGTDPEDLTGSESWVGGGDDLGMRFEGEESFSFQVSR